MTYGEDAEGSEWVLPAQGAAVAAHRLNLGKTPVQLTVANDKGTPDGARDAVENSNLRAFRGLLFLPRVSILRVRRVRHVRAASR